MQDDTTHYYYGFLLGRINYSNYAEKGGSTMVGMGEGDYQVVYSSHGQSGTIHVDTSYKFQAYQYEFLLLKGF
jgi:hypothetical protein